MASVLSVKAPATAAAGAAPGRRRRRTAWRAAGFVVPVWAYMLCFYVYPLLSNVKMGFQ